MIEILFCENGQHDWERENKRGKKPRSCPQHAFWMLDQGEKKQLRMRKLICEHDGHEWETESKRGRPPRFCPKHIADKKTPQHQAKKKKSQRNLEDEITRFSARVGEAASRSKECYGALRSHGDAKNADDKTFNRWLEANTTFLHEVEALRARERKLMEIKERNPIDSQEHHSRHSFMPTRTIPKGFCR